MFPTATTTYHYIDLTLRYLHDIHPKTTLAPFDVHFPTPHATIVANFRAHLRSLRFSIPNYNPEAPGLLTGEGGPKIVAVIDSIVSEPGVRLPWREMVAVCREEGVWSIVDAAHSIGQEPEIKLAVARPDFYVTNCHKWLYAKRSIAVLYVPFRYEFDLSSSGSLIDISQKPTRYQIIFPYGQLIWQPAAQLCASTRMWVVHHSIVLG